MAKPGGTVSYGRWGVSYGAGPVAGYVGWSPFMLLAALLLEEAVLCWGTEPGSQRAEPGSQGTVG